MPRRHGQAAVKLFYNMQKQRVRIFDNGTGEIDGDFG